MRNSHEIFCVSREIYAKLSNEILYVCDLKFSFYPSLGGATGPELTVCPSPPRLLAVRRHDRR